MTPTARPSDADVREMARGLSEAQRELLLRYEATTAEQDITEAECFHKGVELFVELSPEVYDPEYGTLVDPGEKAWFASMGAHSPAGSAEWERCWIAYTPLGLALRRHLMEKDNG